MYFVRFIWFYVLNVFAHDVFNGIWLFLEQNVIFMNINTFPFLHICLEKFPIHIQQLDRWQNSWTGQKDNSHKKPIPFYYS
jgi:hypothetical protein